ncbi:MAG: enoyl-CoA hydratase/isomerase family protein [Nitrospinota bacterium]
MYENIIYEKRDRIGFITVNRPKVLNALNPQTMGELEDALLKARDDGEVKVLILRGAGERAFVAGADINILTELTPEEGKELSASGQRVLNLLENLGKPSIAAIRGFALGGGLELALACTIRVAARGSKLGQPEIKLGVIPGYGGTQRLPRIVGKGKALELILTGDPIDAEEGERLGLINRVVPPEELMPTVEGMANALCEKSAPILRYALEAVNKGLEGSLEQGLALEVNLFGMTYSTEDVREGTKAFLEKRKPEFKDR